MPYHSIFSFSRRESQLYYFANTAQRGGETGATKLNEAPFGKVVLYGLPGITTVATCFWPSLLQLYFFTVGAFSLVQSYVIGSPRFRRWAGIAPLPPPSKTDDNGAPSTRLRLVSDVINATARDAQGHPPPPAAPPRASVIDRALDTLKKQYEFSVKAAKEKVDGLSGSSQTNPNGTAKVPPRLSKKELEDAATYDLRRREEQELDREMRNSRRREQFMKRMEESGKQKERVN
jgi:YidC/Oxa1 family membrane protein insertase